MREVLFKHKAWELVCTGDREYDPSINDVISIRHTKCDSYRYYPRENPRCLVCDKRIPDVIVALFVLYTEGVK